MSNASPSTDAERQASTQLQDVMERLRARV
jgi:hypothetical protein